MSRRIPQRLAYGLALAAAVASVARPPSHATTPAMHVGSPYEPTLVRAASAAGVLGDALGEASTSAGRSGPSEPRPCAGEPPLAEESIPLPASFAALVGETWGMVGSASLGTPTRGSLFGGVELHESEGIRRAGGYGFGTSTVVRSIERAVREVRRCHPGTAPLYVGDLGREHGGWLLPHRSHQSGLDADIGYYYVGEATWYERATAKTLDAPRTWALMRSLIDGGNVDTLFVDTSIQQLLKAHIATLTPSERPADDPFESPRHRDALIRHAYGHRTHFHVRFRDPSAVERGRALAKLDPTGLALRDAPIARLASRFDEL